MKTLWIIIGILLLSALDQIICEEAQEDDDGDLAIIYSNEDKIWKRRFDFSNDPE